MARFILSDEKIFENESNVSLISRIAWKYRIHPSLIIKLLLKGTRSNNSSVDLFYDVASLCNSVSDKAQIVQEGLIRLTGNEIRNGSFSYLRDVLDHASKGFISRRKKWCHICYQERHLVDLGGGETSISDDLYWSFAHSKYCNKHKVTLSEVCGSCFQSQPYVSTKVEPGFCHYCKKSLSIAPSLSPIDDEELNEIELHLNGHDLFISQSQIHSKPTIKSLAKNLRELSKLHGFDKDDAISAACGISKSTLKDWKNGRHNLTVDSILLLISGLGLKFGTDLFREPRSFLHSVTNHFGNKLNFSQKFTHETKMPEIDLFLSEIISGKRDPMSKKDIAEHFDVSVGMIENYSPQKSKQVSDIYAAQLRAARKAFKPTLQSVMDGLVSKRLSKNRKLTWSYILSQNSVIDMQNFDQKQLSVAKSKAINRYLESTQKTLHEINDLL